MNGPNLCVVRGDSFVMKGKLGQNGAVVDITGWEIRSQVRVGEVLVAELDVEITDALKGEFILKALDTTNWPPTTLTFDVHYRTVEGYTHTTPHGRLMVKEGGNYGP